MAKDKDKAKNVADDDALDTVTMDEVSVPETVQLTIVEKHALKRAYDELARVGREMQEVGREIMRGHGIENGDYVISPVDVDAGLVQFLTREQAASAQGPR